MRLFVFRHAESTANAAGIIACSPATAIAEWGLTERGRKQARETLLPFPASEEVMIVSSDLRRARESAEILSARCGASPPRLTPLLRERDFGPFEGQSNERYETVWDYDARHATFPGVEGVESVCLRIRRAMRDLSGATGIVVVVSHGDVLQILLALASGISPFRHRSIPHLGNAEIREVAGTGPGNPLFT